MPARSLAELRRVRPAEAAREVRLAVGDLNGDGKPDLAVTNSAGGTGSLLMQDPANPGRFLAQTKVSVGGYPEGIAIGDLDGDGRNDVAIVRVEQLYPLPVAELQAELSRFPGVEVVWVQEEPANQGAWPFMALNLPGALAALGEQRRLHVASRSASASPASGSTKKHAAEQAELIAAAFAR